MAVLSEKRSEVIQFFTQRLAAWQEDPAAIGLSSGQLAELVEMTSTASGRYQAALAARQFSKDRTLEYHESADTLRAFGAALIATIKAYAETTGDVGVFAQASIPEPADPSPSAAPAVPTNITLCMRAQGAIEIAWQGSLAGGTFYEVQRSMDDGDNWSTVASIPARETLDETVPQGTARVYYRIRGVKGPAGAGSPDRAPRYSHWTPPMVVFMGKPVQPESARAAA